MCRIDAFNVKHSFAFLGYGNVYSGELELSIFPSARESAFSIKPLDEIGN